MKIFILSLVFLLHSAFGQEVFPGAIPKFYSIKAATDLEYPSEVAHQMALNGEDISLLSPDKTTNIWSPQNKTIKVKNLLPTGTQVQFNSTLPSESGIFRFSVKSKNENYNIFISKKNHRRLLRKNILEKIGYILPELSWSPKIKIQFKDSIDKTLFLAEFEDQVFEDKKRWIVSQSELEITLQDVVIKKSNSNIYDLASGKITRCQGVSDTGGCNEVPIHLGRRLLRSVYVPLAIVDTSESINFFSWKIGRIVLGQIILNHSPDLINKYQTSFEDAQWVTRRILKLSKKDIQEIVKNAYYPIEVQKLLVEKICSRINDLSDLLDLKKKTPLKFNPELSYGPHLKNGKLTKEFFIGYASRFSYGDPESPFSSSEMSYFALAKIQSELIRNSINFFNSKLGTNDKELYKNKLNDIVKNQGLFFPTQAVMIPSVHGSITLSRDVIVGSYLGVNNRVQLVDNFGIGLNVGVFSGLEGIPSFLKVNGTANIQKQRVYSHIKSFKNSSLKKAFKTPYKNMIVPLMTHSFFKKIDKISISGSDEQKQIEVDKVINLLKEFIEIGESFVITDSFAPTLGLQGSYSFSQMNFLPERLLKVYVQAQSQKLTISRLHFHRASDNLFHIYKDYGKGLKLIFSAKLKSYLPILSISYERNAFEAETKFFEINTDQEPEKAASLLKKFRKTFLTLNSKFLEKEITPHRIEQKFKENIRKFSFLFFKKNKVQLFQDMSFFHALGGKVKNVKKRFDAFINGKDYENFFSETVSDSIADLWETEVGISNNDIINPGNTILGQAKNVLLTSELEDGEITTKIQYIHNGWGASKKKILKKIKELNEISGLKLFDPLDFSITKKILLYQAQIQASIHPDGITRLLDCTNNQIKTLLKLRSSIKNNEDLLQSKSSSIYNSLVGVKKKLAQSPKKSLKKLHKTLKEIVSLIGLDGLSLLTKKENLYYFGKFDGFREGDEKGDSPIKTHVYGNLPLPLHDSPLDKIQINWRILPGELNGAWLTTGVL